MTQQNDFGLTETQKEEIDEIALQRVRAVSYTHLAFALAPS